MRTEYLTYFLCAAELESVSKAADRLHLTPQGLSRVIRLLEKTYDVQLFHRNGASIRLTPAGETLREYAAEAVHSCNKLEERMGQLSGAPQTAPKDCLSISMTNVVLHDVFPFCLTSILSFFPNCSIRVNEVEERNVLDLVMGNGDPSKLFFTGIISPFKDAYIRENDLDFRPLMKLELGCIVRRDSALANLPVIRWSDLQKYDLIVRKDIALENVLVKKELEGILDRAILCTSDDRLIEQGLEAADAIAFASSMSSLYPRKSGYVYIPMEEPVCSSVGFIGNRNFELSPQALRLREFVELFFFNNHPKCLYDKGETAFSMWKPVFTAP